MKACIIQPPYSRDTSFSDEYFQFKVNMLEACDEAQARKYIDMGVDTILTNNYNLVNEGKYAL